MTKIGLNGAGRIGRSLIRLLRERGDLELVAVNDVAAVESVAHLIAHDSVHGAFPGTVALRDGALLLDGRAVTFTRADQPESIPWLSDVDVVVEATGRFVETPRRYVNSGAQRV